MSDRPRERRGTRRLETMEEHGIVSARVTPGYHARLIDVSAAGALIETTHRLLPGRDIELHVETSIDRASIRGQVVRCAIVRVRPTWVCYRGAIVFERHLPWFVDSRRELATPEVI